MEESGHEQLKALARRDGERALALAVSAFVHELRNCINPLGLQLAILQRRVPTQSEELGDVLDGLRESIERAHETLNRASRLADAIAPPDTTDADNADDADRRQLWDQLCRRAGERTQDSAISKVVPAPGSDS